MNRVLFIILFVLMSDCLMAQDGAGVSVPNIVLETPSSPLAWTVVCILAFIILILISVILVMTKKKLAMDTSLNPEIKKEVEEVYARKVKREYLDKQKVLDNKLNQVRLRFSIVMGKVKTLLDTLSPDKLFNAICDLIQTDVGANRYIIFLRDEIKHECAVAMVVLRRPPSSAADFGGTKLSLLMEKQHNRGQDGAGAAILTANPEPGEEPYWIAKSASSTPLVDVLGSIAKRPHISSHRGTETQREDDLARFKESPEPHNPIKKRCASVPLCEKIFLGHLRYATFGKNEVAFCHPFVHEASELEHTLLLAGNFNLTNAHELFEDYSRHGSFPTSKADGYLICELIAHELREEGLQTSDFGLRCCSDVGRPMSEGRNLPIATALSKALANADGAWTLCGMTGDGWAFATRDPHGIRPGFYFISDDVVAVASERPAIQAAFDVPPEAVKELPPGQALVVSPTGETTFESLSV